MPSNRNDTHARWLRLQVAAILALASHQAGAWHQGAHHLCTEAAIELLPNDMPPFFRQGAVAAAHHTIDPDLARHRGLPPLRAAEGPEHYFDLELLENHTLAEDRHEFIKFCESKRIPLKKIGLLPYAIVENTQHLMLAFAEHRRWPDNPHIRIKCLVRAGTLAHYAQDTCQPLHTTIHFDGRVGDDGQSPHTGIHQRTDALIDRLGLTKTTAKGGAVIRPLDHLLDGVLRQMRRSHRLVDRVYELEAQLPARDGSNWQPTEPVRQFARERLQAATRFTASLYVTAWRASADVQLPHWLRRESDAATEKSEQ